MSKPRHEDRTAIDLKSNPRCRRRPRSLLPSEMIEDPIVRARSMMASCLEQYKQVSDYTCTFYKRERVDGVLLPYQVMEMKARTQPFSVYMRFVRPARGPGSDLGTGRQWR